MKTTEKIRLLTLTIILVFTIVGIASAGAVIRRSGSDRGQGNDQAKVEKKQSEQKDSSSRGSRPQVTRDNSRPDRSNRSSEQARQTRQPNQRDDGPSYRPTERTQPTVWTQPERNSTVDRTPKDRNIDSTPSYRPIEKSKPTGPKRTVERTERDSNIDPSPSYRPSERSQQARVDSSIDRTMRNKSIDATPTYRPSNNNRYSDTDNRSSYYRLHRNEPADRKYTRIDEREDNNRSRVSYHPPVHRGGYYYYDSGWVHHYDYPLRYGFWYFDYVPDHCYRSAYFYYGYFPYIPAARIIIVRRPVVAYVEIPIVIHKDYYETGYYLEDPYANSVDRVLGDIRRAWMSNDPDLLLQYVSYNNTIDVLLEGKYAYSINAEDYMDMTSDAVKSTETSDFEYISVRKRGDDRIVAYARHRFYNLNDELQTVYVSYELERHGREWIITEVGSSPRQLVF